MENNRNLQGILEDVCHKGPFDIDQLVVESAKLIPLFAGEQSRYRVSVYPDDRTIRFYITQGLVDRPSEYQRGASVFGVRHLLQVLAIKKLQAEYLPLRKIKELIAGLEDDGLKEVLLRESGGGIRQAETAQFNMMTLSEPKPSVAPTRMASFRQRANKYSGRGVFDNEEEVLPRKVCAKAKKIKEDRISESKCQSLSDSVLPRPPETAVSQPENWLRMKVSDNLEISLKYRELLPADRELLERLAIKVRLILEDERRRKNE